MDIKPKQYIFLSSYKNIISIAWFLNKKFNLNLSQKIKKLGKEKIIVFEDKSEKYRITLVSVKDLKISPKLAKFDYLLILENFYINDLSVIKSPEFVVYYLKIDLNALPKSTAKTLEKI